MFLDLRLYSTIDIIRIPSYLGRKLLLHRAVALAVSQGHRVAAITNSSAGPIFPEQISYSFQVFLSTSLAFGYV
jgi:hypothetical protein